MQVQNQALFRGRKPISGTRSRRGFTRRDVMIGTGMLETYAPGT
ncbi:hypothetical protein ACVA51_19775 [Pseudomonas luteola]